MAATVQEEYTYDVNIQESGAGEQNVRVVAWNTNNVQEFSVLTDVNGDIATQNVQAASYSVAGFVTTPTLFNPFNVRALKWGFNIEQFQVTINSASGLTIFITTNTNLTETNQTTVQAYTGASVSHVLDTVTLSGAASGTVVNNMDRLYDYLQNESIVTFQPPNATSDILSTTDGLNYVMDYALTIDGNTNTIDLDGQGRSIAGFFQVNLQNGGEISDITLDADLFLQTGSAGTPLNGVTITAGNEVEFSEAGTYTFTDCNIAEVSNISGGAVTINAVDTTISLNSGPNITINNAVPITITVLDATTNNPVQGARVFLEESPGGTDLLNELTNASGQVTDTYNYLSDQDVVGRVRRGTTTPLYKTAPLSGTITSSGFAATAFLIRDD